MLPTKRLLTTDRLALLRWQGKRYLGPGLRRAGAAAGIGAAVVVEDLLHGAIVAPLPAALPRFDRAPVPPSRPYALVVQLRR